MHSYQGVWYIDMSRLVHRSKDHRHNNRQAHVEIKAYSVVHFNCIAILVPRPLPDFILQSWRKINFSPRLQDRVAWEQGYCIAMFEALHH